MSSTTVISSPVPVAPAPPKKRWLRVLVWLLAIIVLLITLIIAGVFWLLQTTSGQHRLLGWLPGLTGNMVQVNAPSGNLLSDFSAQSIHIKTATASIEIQSPQYQLREHQWWPLQLAFDRLHIDQVNVLTTPSDEPASPPPADLKLPLTLSIDQLSIDQVKVRSTAAPAEDAGTVITNVQAKVALTAEQHELRLDHASLNNLLLKGEATLGAAAPIAVKAQFNAQHNDSAAEDFQWVADASIGGTLQALDVKAKVNALDQTLDAQAIVQPFSEMPISTLNAAFNQFNLQKIQAGLPQTRLDGRAVIALDQSPFKVDLDIKNAIPGSLDRQKIPLNSLTVRAESTFENPKLWQIDAFDAQLRGNTNGAGRITGAGAWKDGPWNAQLQVHDVLLHELQKGLPSIALNGQVTASSENIDFKQHPLQLQAQINASPRGERKQLPPALRQGAKATLAAQVQPDRITLKQLDLQADKAQLNLEAVAQRSGGSNANNAAQWQVNVQTRWSEIDPFQFGVAALNNQRALLNGNSTITLTLPEANPAHLQSLEIAAQLERSEWGQQPLAAVISAKLLTPITDPQQLPRIESDSRISIGTNKAEWSGRLGAAGDVLNWSIDAPAWGDLLAKLTTPGAIKPPQGQISGKGSLAGNWQQLAIKADINGSNLIVADTALGLLKANIEAQLTPEAPFIIDAKAQGLSPIRPAGSKDTSPAPKADLTLQGQGSLSAHRIVAQAQIQQGDRRITLDSLLTGKLDFDANNAPQQWHGSLEKLLANETSQAGQNTRQLINVSPVQASWQRGTDAQQITVESGSATALSIPLRWDRILFKQPTSGAPDFSANGSVGPFNVAQAARQLDPTQTTVNGDLVLAGTFAFKGLPGNAGFDGQLTLDRVSGDLRGGEDQDALNLGLSALSLKLETNNDRWRLLHTAKGSQLGELMAEASVDTQRSAGLPEASSPLSGRLAANVRDLSVWGNLLPTGWRIGGGVGGEARLSGTLGEPYGSGALNLNNLSLRNPLEGIEIVEGQGQIVFDGNQIKLNNVVAKAGKGQLQVSGAGPLDGSSPMLLNVVLQNFGALTRVDRRIDVSGQAALSLSAKQITINGKLTVDRGLIDITQFDSPTLSEDVIVVRKSTPPDAAVKTTKTFPAQLNLNINLGQDLRLIGRGIETHLVGELSLTSPNGVLSANGNIRTRGGRYLAYGQNLEIDRGVVRFVGPVNNPTLDILALRQNRESEDRVGVSVSGTALQPRVKLYAVPDRSDTDKLAMLILGRSFDELGRDEMALVQTAALALLAGENSDGGIAGMFGLDTLTLRQNETGSTREVVIGVGKQLSEKLYVGYEQGLASTTGTLQLIYRVSQRFTVRAQAGADSSLDAIWSFRWR